MGGSWTVCKQNKSMIAKMDDTVIKQNPVIKGHWPAAESSALRRKWVKIEHPTLACKEYSSYNLVHCPSLTLCLRGFILHSVLRKVNGAMAA